MRRKQDRFASGAGWWLLLPEPSCPGHDQAAGFGFGMKCTGDTRPTARVLPAHQGLYTGQAALTVHLRLVVQQQRRGLGFQRSAQVAAQRQAFAGGFLQGVGEKYTRLSPASLVRCMAVSASRSSSGASRLSLGIIITPARQTGAAPGPALPAARQSQPASVRWCAASADAWFRSPCRSHSSRAKGVTIHPGQPLALVAARSAAGPWCATRYRQRPCRASR